MRIFINDENYIVSFDNIYNNYNDGLEVNFDDLPQNFYTDYNKYKYINNQFIYDDTFYHQQQLEKTKNKKLQEISDQCEEHIYKGIDCETSLGIEHFSLIEKDQLNLKTTYDEILRGNIKQIEYHSDTNLCRFFSCNEIINLYTKAMMFIKYHRTYCNHLNVWTRRSKNIEEINNIYYGCELPEDLKENMYKLYGDKIKI